MVFFKKWGRKEDRPASKKAVFTISVRSRFYVEWNHLKLWAFFDDEET